MRPGRKRDKIRIERPIQSRNSISGATEKAWQMVALRSAKISAINGSEQAFLGSGMSETNTLVFVRYDRSMLELSTEWRVVDDRTGRVYDIEYHDPITSGMRDLKIRCVHRSK